MAELGCSLRYFGCLLQVSVIDKDEQLRVLHCNDVEFDCFGVVERG